MCELAVEHTSTWLMVDPWEAGQPEYQRTAVVLDHFDEMLNGKDGERGVEMRNGGRRKYKVMLLAGGDLIESFGEPGVWSAPDVSRANRRWRMCVCARWECRAESSPSPSCISFSDDSDASLSRGQARTYGRSCCHMISSIIIGAHSVAKRGCARYHALTSRPQTQRDCDQTAHLQRHFVDQGSVRAALTQGIAALSPLTFPPHRTLRLFVRRGMSIK